MLLLTFIQEHNEIPICDDVFKHVLLPFLTIYDLLKIVTTTKQFKKLIQNMIPDHPYNLHNAVWEGPRLGYNNPFILPQNLHNYILVGADLALSNLKYANLTNANLTNANLRGANLKGANLTNANLRGANLTDANLSDANLENANLHYVNITGINLENANKKNATFLLVFSTSLSSKCESKKY
jgi:uncharacterized protein YjbI with pentapeptide repeats